METGWQSDGAADLQALKRLAALQQLVALAPLTEADYAAAGYPSEEEDWEAFAHQPEGETDDWDTYADDVRPLFGSQWHAALTGPRQPGWVAASWPVLKARVVKALRAWPRNAPFMPGPSETLDR